MVLRLKRFYLKIIVTELHIIKFVFGNTLLSYTILSKFIPIHNLTLYFSKTSFNIELLSVLRFFE
jgi:hypothetical protein